MTAKVSSTITLQLNFTDVKTCVCVAAVTIYRGEGRINNGWRLRAGGRTDTHTGAHTARDTVGG